MPTTTRIESAGLDTQLVTEVSGHEGVNVSADLSNNQSKAARSASLKNSGSGDPRAIPSGLLSFDLSESLRRIPDRVFFRIGDVAELLEVKPYVLRYWESEFPMIAPQKSSSGQRVYRRTDVETVMLIKHLLYHERYSIEGARKKIRELRKDGEIKAIKTESRQVLEKSRKLKAVAHELRSLIQQPLRDIFKY
ncbi:MAG: MerR family transcriptional regulator [Methylotenera sp.]|nr:MerR family transcriptional regulator [Oligoflexia bacterium]